MPSTEFFDGLKQICERSGIPPFKQWAPSFAAITYLCACESCLKMDLFSSERCSFALLVSPNIQQRASIYYGVKNICWVFKFVY